MEGGFHPRLGDDKIREDGGEAEEAQARAKRQDQRHETEAAGGRGHSEDEAQAVHLGDAARLRVAPPPVDLAGRAVVVVGVAEVEPGRRLRPRALLFFSRHHRQEDGGVNG